MSNAIVIGNGESRRGFDLNKLNGHGTTYGCNALHRDYKCDVFSACDRRMVQEIVEHGYEVYTRPEWQNAYKNEPLVKCYPPLPYTGNTRPDEPFQWGSGPYAILLALQEHDVDKIYMLGFDLYGLKDHTKHNNMYKDTKGYEGVDYRAVGPQYWIHQISMLFHIFGTMEFIVVKDDDWDECPEWDKHKNLEYINYARFIATYNT